MRDNQVMNREHLSEDLLNMYLDGELSDGERDSVEAHLAVCNACQAEFSDMQQLFVALDELAVAAAPDLLPGVLKRVGSQPTRPQLPASGFQALPWFTAALQAITAMALLAWGWRHLANLWSTVRNAIPAETVRSMWPQVSGWAMAQWTALSAWPGAAWAEILTWMTRLSSSIDLPLPLTQVAVLGVALVFVWLLGNGVILRRARLNGQIRTQRWY